MIQIQDSGIQSLGGNVQYLWFKIHDLETRRTYFRAIALQELAAIPVSIREEYDLLKKQGAAVRGLYNAEADYVYSAAGIFKPEHIGIVQMYGGVGVGDTLDTAAGFALRNIATIKATMANYEQSRLAPVNPLWVEWYLDFITARSCNVMALLGHPDPRQTRRGLGKDGELAADPGDDLAVEQNEMLFRGLAKLRQDFIFQVTSERINRKHISKGLVKIAQVVSSIASRQYGSKSISFSMGVPIMASISQATSGGNTVADSHSHGVSTGTSRGWGTSHTESSSLSTGGSEGYSFGRTHSVSSGHTESSGTSQSESFGTSHSSSVGGSSSWSNGTSSATSMGTSSGQSTGSTLGEAHGTSSSSSMGTTSGESTGHSDGWSNGTGTSDTQSLSQGTSDTVGGGVSGGLPGVATASANYNHGWSQNSGASHAESASSGLSGSDSSSSSTGVSASSSNGASSSWSSGSSNSASTGSSASSSTGSSSSVGGSSSWGISDGTSHSFGSSTSQGVANSTGVADSVSESWSKSNSWSQSKGVADGTSNSWGRSQSDSSATAQAVGRSLSQGYGTGFSTGFAPSVSIGRSWQTEDDVAIRLTQLMRQFEGQLNQASADGGFLTTAVLFTDNDIAEAAARALVPQAFHGTNVPTPVLTVQPSGQDAQDFRDHALAWLNYTGLEENDILDGYLFTKYATLLTTDQNAAYTAPGLFEEGTASTIMAPIPKGLGFYPTMKGDVVIGHQYSPETADLTTASVRLDEPRMMHTMFAGDTGWGKSVAAIMMAYESTLRWKTRTVVLDFGAGWRQLLNAPGLEGHVNILQLWPDAVRPFRWNPLQIGRQINPETQWRAFADIFGSIAKLGVKRQKQELLDALRSIYVRYGVLIDDPLVRAGTYGAVVSTGEEAVSMAPIGTSIDNLDREQRQALAVYRSSRVGLIDLYTEIETRRSLVAPRDTMLQGVLDGIIFRLNPLVQGAAALQFAAGPGAVPIEDLSRPWGITVIEGGAFLDDFGKAFLLGWAGWHLYTDMVARRVHEVTNSEPLLQIYFEEANKVFGGVGDGGGDDESGGVSTSQRFADMFRDARKYKCRLHVVTQAPSLIPQDIVSSCNNLVVGFLKQPKDKDIVLSAMAKSEKGFRDEEWRRFITNQPIGMAVGRFPYTMDRELQQPFLFKPLMLNVPEPTDAEIGARLGRIRL